MVLRMVCFCTYYSRGITGLFSINARLILPSIRVCCLSTPLVMTPSHAAWKTLANLLSSQRCWSIYTPTPEKRQQLYPTIHRYVWVVYIYMVTVLQKNPSTFVSHCCILLLQLFYTCILLEMHKQFSSYPVRHAEMYLYDHLPMAFCLQTSPVVLEFCSKVFLAHIVESTFFNLLPFFKMVL